MVHIDLPIDQGLCSVTGSAGVEAKEALDLSRQTTSWEGQRIRRAAGASLYISALLPIFTGFDNRCACHKLHFFMA